MKYMGNMLSSFIFRIFFGKESETMMAMLWCQQIILGKKTFDQVPAKLREDVAELLRDSGLGNLVSE